ncbi:MAG: carbohydrate ABC transporter permease [Clostridia bacterium]|nr:carbohydrate ABC transporter permease [Clostridia bacterium]
MTLTAVWKDEEEARKLATAEGEQIAAELFGGSFEPWQAEVDEPTAVSENVKTWPNTALITAFVALAALAVSFALFSQQPLFDTCVVIFFVLFTFICVFPFYYLFINTISDNNLVAGGQINFLPQGIHFKNYERILGQEELKDALIVTVSRTVLGTALMVLTSAWAGYLVTKRKMWHRSFWYRALVVTMYFNAGLIPWYTNMLMLGLTGNFLAYIIPGMVAPYNIILVKTYIESIPGSLEESAIIDGASTFKVFLKIILPLSIPILATISIFGAVGNWNSFQDSLLLMSSTPKLYTLQHRLYIYLNQTTSINTEQISEQMAQNLLNNGVTTKYTIAMITIIPILLVYPFMQRYFVKGIMLGAVKG